MFSTLLLAALLLAPAESPDGLEHVNVYMTEEEALARVFPDADAIDERTWAPSPEEREALEARLGWRVSEETFRIFGASRGGSPIGSAVVTEQIGLYKPITFLVAVDPVGVVSAVHVLVYRESRGGEVRRARFLRQYRGKTSTSPVRLNRDIVGVTGATFSVRAINAGVKRVLAVLDLAPGGGAR